MTQVTRRYRFSASHRLHSPSLNADENALLYGKCNNPFGHGHDYILEVTVSGPIDPQTGLILPVSKLDTIVQEKIISVLSSRNLNLDVPQFSTLVPTTENILEVIGGLLQEDWREQWGDSLYLQRIHLQETARNGFEVLFGNADGRSADGSTEGVLTNA